MRLNNGLFAIWKWRGKPINEKADNADSSKLRDSCMYRKNASNLRATHSAGRTYSARSTPFRRGGAPVSRINEKIYPSPNSTGSAEAQLSYNSITATGPEDAAGRNIRVDNRITSSAGSSGLNSADEVAQLRKQLSSVKQQNAERLAAEKRKHDTMNNKLRQQLEECQEEKMDLAIVNSTMQVEGDQIDKLKTEIDKLKTQLQFKTEELRKSDSIKLKLQKQQQQRSQPLSQHVSRSRSSVSKKIAKVIPSKKRQAIASRRLRGDTFKNKIASSATSRRRTARESPAAMATGRDPSISVTREPSEMLLTVVNKILLHECKKELMQLMFSSGSLDAITSQCQPPRSATHARERNPEPIILSRRQIATDLSPFFRRSATKYGSPMLDTPTPSKRIQYSGFGDEDAENTKLSALSEGEKPIVPSSDLGLPFLTPSVGSGINAPAHKSISTPASKEAKAPNIQWLSRQFTALVTVIMDWTISQKKLTPPTTASMSETRQKEIVQKVEKIVSAIGSFIHLVLVTATATSTRVAPCSSLASPPTSNVTTRTLSLNYLANFTVVLESALKVRSTTQIQILSLCARMFRCIDLFYGVSYI